MDILEMKKPSQYIYWLTIALFLVFAVGIGMLTIVGLQRAALTYESAREPVQHAYETKLEYLTDALKQHKAEAQVLKHQAENPVAFTPEYVSIDAVVIQQFYEKQWILLEHRTTDNVYREAVAGKDLADLLIGIYFPLPEGTEHILPPP